MMVLAMFVSTQPTQAAVTSANWVSVSAGYQHTCAIDSVQRVSCWGVNDSGDLGNGTNDIVEVPTVIKTTSDIVDVKFAQVSASYTHTCALSTVGLAYCWGSNDQGQLGNPSIATSSNVAVPVDTTGVLNGVVLTQIDAGINHTCALDASGNAYCWGANDDGQLGNGTTDPSSSPVSVDTSGVLSGVPLAQISVGSILTCALDTSGLAYCWGYGPDGQIGDGQGRTINPSPVAVDTTGVIGSTVLTQISVGDSSVCAADSAGNYFCWGLNDQGQLGDGTTTKALSPIQVATAGVLTSGKSVSLSTGGTFACSITDVGVVGCWGDGLLGQLGNGDTSTSGSPVDVMHTGAAVLAGVKAVQISSGYAHVCVVGNTHHLYCWGLNDNGQLGTGSDTTVATGIPVLALDPPILGPVLVGDINVTVEGVVGEALAEMDISAQISGAALSYQKISGSLPPGVSLSRSDGLLSGKPTASGSFTSVISASNTGGSILINLTINVAKASTTPTDGVVVIDKLGASGKTKNVEINKKGILFPRLTTMYAGPITGTATVLYKDLTTNKLGKFQCVFKTFGQLKAFKKIKMKGKKFPSHDYTTKKGCQLSPAVRKTLAKGKVRIKIKLHFVRHWPTNYKLKTPAGRKILPQNISIVITAGAGKISN